VNADVTPEYDALVDDVLGIRMAHAVRTESLCRLLVFPPDHRSVRERVRQRVVDPAAPRLPGARTGVVDAGEDAVRERDDAVVHSTTPSEFVGPSRERIRRCARATLRRERTATASVTACARW
jgi:hypothetical protein